MPPDALGAGTGPRIRRSDAASSTTDALPRVASGWVSNPLLRCFARGLAVRPLGIRGRRRGLSDGERLWSCSVAVVFSHVAICEGCGPVTGITCSAPAGEADRPACRMGGVGFTVPVVRREAGLSGELRPSHTVVKSPFQYAHIGGLLPASSGESD